MRLPFACAPCYRVVVSHSSALSHLRACLVPPSSQNVAPRGLQGIFSGCIAVLTTSIASGKAPFAYGLTRHVQRDEKEDEEQDADDAQADEGGADEQPGDEDEPQEKLSNYLVDNWEEEGNFLDSFQFGTVVVVLQKNSAYYPALSDAETTVAAFENVDGIDFCQVEVWFGVTGINLITMVSLYCSLFRVSFFRSLAIRTGREPYPRNTYA